MTSVEPISDLAQVSAFLKRYEETSQFLINNLRDRGPVVTDDPYSGNFKVIKQHDQIVAVFYLARCGNVFAQTAQADNGQAGSAQLTDLILEACKSEPFPIKGFIGAWPVLAPIFEKFCAENPQFKPSYVSKEILYRLGLAANDSRLQQHPQVRLLVESDFADWHPLRSAYLEELHLTSDSDADRLRARFASSTGNKTWWGFFDDGKLISIAGLNSKSDEIGQVGGVFTPKEKRKHGYAKATMLHLLKDCRDFHGHAKSILFTGENDLPAQKLYESIGYERIGHFALILS